MEENLDQSDITESVEELKMKLKAMKRMIENDDINKRGARNRRNVSTCKASIIDGNFLSIIFAIVLILIVVVSTYAFFNLFTAVRKKYASQHSEL